MSLQAEIVGRPATPDLGDPDPELTFGGIVQWRHDLDPVRPSTIRQNIDSLVSVFTSTPLWKIAPIGKRRGDAKIDVPLLNQDPGKFSGCEVQSKSARFARVDL